MSLKSVFLAFHDLVYVIIAFLFLQIYAEYVDLKVVPKSLSITHVYVLEV